MGGKYEEKVKADIGLMLDRYDMIVIAREADAEIADLREKCDKLAGWVSVEDRLPVGGGDCIAINAAPETYGYGECVIGYMYNVGDFYVCESEYEIVKGITHWMPKPDPIQIAREVRK